jgi:hypothetical protein
VHEHVLLARDRNLEKLDSIQVARDVEAGWNHEKYYSLFVPVRDGEVFLLPIKTLM